MDQGIIQCFKAHYYAKYIQCAIDCYDAGVTLSEIYDIDQLEAMWLAEAAWHEVDTITIRNCWKKAAILPLSSLPVLNPSIPVSSLLNVDDTHGLKDPVTIVEKQLESALDELVSTGALQASNRMDIEALLNPADESHVIDETTDEEICQAVLDARKAQEEGPINGGDNDVDDDAPVEPCPTRREVLQAAAVINKYIDGVDDPSARKLEGILASFKRQMRLEMSSSMNSTHLTDYFHRI